MAAANWTWGAERIRGELLKLHIQVAKATIQKYLRGARPPRRSGQSWSTFLHNHAQGISACDSLPVTDLLFRSIHAFFVMELASRRIVHVGVTCHPSDACGVRKPQSGGASLIVVHNATERVPTEDRAIARTTR